MEKNKIAHIISHTHWDREWYLNSKYTNEWLVPFFESLFDMMEKEPEYRFVLDGQTSMIEDYLEQLEQQGKDVDRYKQKIKQYAASKRLVVGPYYLQPDWQLISEEAIVRNLMIGFKTASEFGEPMQVGWLLDNFGQISQAPQIHKQFGMFGLFVWRGVEMDPNDLNSEFAWESPDGTVMPGVYFLSSYRNAMRLAEYQDMMQERVENEVRKIFPFATTPNVLLMNGYDQEMVPDDIIPNIQNGKMDFEDFRVIQSTPEDYMRAVLSHAPALKKLKGALYSGRYISVFPGILSSRMYLKIQNDICQNELSKYAEPLQTILWCNGGEYQAAKLDKSWKVLLKNHPHDSICGVSIDDVHTDMETRFDESYCISNGLVNESLRIFAGNVDTGKYPDALFSIIVFNTMATERNGMAVIRNENKPDLIFKDSHGNLIPGQKDGNGTVKIYLKEIPALGYTTLFAFPAEKAGNEEFFDENGRLIVDETARTIENRFVKVEINENGTLNVFDKLNDIIYSSIASFEDGADAGDEYNYSYPEKDRVFTSINKKAEIVFDEKGPIRALVRVKLVLDLPEGLSGGSGTRSEKLRRMPVITWITLEANNPVIKFKTKVLNTVKNHRFRVLFPTGIKSDVSFAETQFDVIQRKIIPNGFDNSTIPENVRRIIIGAREPKPITTFPQRTFVALGDGKTGVAVFNRGLPEYEIIKEKSTIALTLFRGINWITRDDLKTRIGDAGPAIYVPDAQCLREMEFNYSFYSHRGNYENGKVLSHADQFNTGIISVKTDVHKGTLPGMLQLARVDDSTGCIKVSAVKRSEDGKGIIIRLFNSSCQEISAGIKFFSKIRGAYHCDLNERITGEVGIINGDSLEISVKSKRIITLKVEIPLTNKINNVNDVPLEVYRDELAEACDFTDYQTVELITGEEIQKEEERALALEKEFEVRENVLEEYKKNNIHLKETDEWKKGCNKLQLDVETCRRASLEARLSVLLIRKKAIENNIVEVASKEKEIQAIEDEITAIGYKLNEARVSKRVYEYIVDIGSPSA